MAVDGALRHGRRIGKNVLQRLQESGLEIVIGANAHKRCELLGDGRGIGKGRESARFRVRQGATGPRTKRLLGNAIVCEDIGKIRSPLQASVPAVASILSEYIRVGLMGEKKTYSSMKYFSSIQSRKSTPFALQTKAI